MKLENATEKQLKAEIKKREEDSKKKGSLKAADLSVLAYANNLTLWHYTTVDNTATIESEHYFNNAADMLRVNDLMIINVDKHGEPATKFYIVTGNDDGNITVSAYT